MAKSIRFVREVFCHDEYADTRPDKAHITVSPELAKRILTLAQAVKKLNVYKVVEFDYTPKWKEQGVKDPDWHVDCVTLNVTNDDFFWDGYIKHTNIAIESANITLAELKKKMGRAG